MTTNSSESGPNDMMNTLKIILAVAAMSFLPPSPALAADKVTLQLKWAVQAQFAGYLVAKEKGFYADEALDVSIMPGGPGITPIDAVKSGKADVVVEWMSTTLAEREKGFALVNIAQPFAYSGLMLTCLKSAGVFTPEDFPGKTLGVWFYGNEYPFFSWMNRLGLKTDGSPGSVKVLEQQFSVEPLLKGQAACISTMTYNEYWQIIDAGVAAEDLVTFKYEDQGISLLEDGLYVDERRLADPHFRDVMVRFVRASMKGWRHAEANASEVGKLMAEIDKSKPGDSEGQARMMRQIAQLTDGSSGALNPESFTRTVAVLAGKSSDTAKELYKGAWTDALTKLALQP